MMRTSKTCACVLRVGGVGLALAFAKQGAAGWKKLAAVVFPSDRSTFQLWLADVKEALCFPASISRTC